jgi:hypothetical protein
MNYILLKIINLLHIIFLLFVLVTPTTKSKYFLTMHAIFIPFLMVHWILNENVCALTLFEKQIKYNLYGDGFDAKNDCITCKLIEPVYDFKKNHESKTVFIYLTTTLLWCISISKLYCMYKNGEIKTWKDFLTI